jgi:hypothetical protein
MVEWLREVRSYTVVLVRISFVEIFSSISGTVVCHIIPKRRHSYIVVIFFYICLLFTVNVGLKKFVIGFRYALNHIFGGNLWNIPVLVIT